MNQDALRRRLREWQTRNGWSFGQISRAMHVSCGSAYITEQRMGDFARRDMDMSDSHCRALTAFLDQWPDTGPFEEWRAELARLARARKLSEQDAVMMQAVAQEEKRAAYVRECLSQEKPKLKSRFPAGIIPPRHMLSDHSNRRRNSNV